VLTRSIAEEATLRARLSAQKKNQQEQLFMTSLIKTAPLLAKDMINI